MKRNLLLTLIIALSLSVLGNPVDENTAKQLAQNFWKENNIMGVKGDKVFKKKMDDARFVNVAPQCGYSEFYIFNNEGGKGFVIIAADDCVTPILGYSYDNNFATESLPPNLKGWLDGYAEQIQAAVEMRAPASEESRIDWECLRQRRNLPIRSETAVNPLITTKWGQSPYYNELCPLNIIYGIRTPTGCVATAMAQIMKYWNYPSHGYNYHSYECWPYGTQSANFAGTNYQWSLMPDSLWYGSTNAQINAVATLMYHCGVSVEMDYGINGSGAGIIYNDYGGIREYCAENAFKDYFGYDASSIQGLKKNSYPESTWISLLINELNNNRPILYGGQGNGEAHAFVCDGYNTANMFHFNWGWDGEGQGTNNNAHFYLGNLNPTVNGQTSNYSNYQVAVIGIKPDDILQSFDLVLYDDVQMVGDNYGNYSFGQDISAYTEILNNGNSTFDGYIAAAVFDDDNYFIDFLGGGAATIEPNYWTSGTVTHEGGIPFLPSYDYLYHTIMFYSVDGTYWSMVNPGNYDNDAVFQVFNNGEDIVTYSEFTFSNGEDNVLYNNQEITINVDVINEGTETYYGSIWLCLTNYNTNSSQVVDILYVDDGLPPNYHYINGINFTNNISLPIGEYYLELMYVKDEHLFYAGSVFYPCIKRVYMLNSPYTINVSANPTNGGTITGQGEYLEGETCTLYAMANNGYTFVNWTENGTQVSTDSNYTFTVTENRNLVANFQTQPQQYTISVSANPSNGGSVSGGGTYNQGQSCTVSATANSDYTFVNWTENGTLVSTNANYTFTVTGSRNLVANFQAQPQQYTISVSANPSNGGIVSGGGTFNQGQSCTVHATANTGYTFVNWTENGTQVSTNANYTFTVTSNRNLVAHFTTQGYVITAIADPSVGGVVTGSGGYNYGETCTLNATANTGYTFQKWTKNGTQVSTNPTYSFTVTESATYTAHFNAQNYTVTVTANPNNAGSVSGGGSYTYGQTCTVTASSNNGYAFTNWTENGSQVSTSASYSFTITGNRNLVANFVQNTHTIHATAGANGIITPSGTITVAHGASQSFSMIPDSDYEVQEVYIDGNPIGAMTSYTFTNVTADHYIHVTFTHVDAINENNCSTIYVYPNPTSGEITLEGEGLNHVRIVNAYGQTVYNAKVEGEQVRIDLSNVAKGIYMMHIEAEGGQTVRKIVVE